MTKLIFPLSKLAEHTINKKYVAARAHIVLQPSFGLKYGFPAKFIVNFTFQPFLDYPGWKATFIFIRTFHLSEGTLTVNTNPSWFSGPTVVPGTYFSCALLFVSNFKHHNFLLCCFLTVLFHWEQVGLLVCEFWHLNHSRLEQLGHYIMSAASQGSFLLYHYKIGNVFHKPSMSYLLHLLNASNHHFSWCTKMT